MVNFLCVFICLILRSQSSIFFCFRPLDHEKPSSGIWGLRGVTDNNTVNTSSVQNHCSVFNFNKVLPASTVLRPIF